MVGSARTGDSSGSVSCRDAGVRDSGRARGADRCAHRAPDVVIDLTVALADLDVAEADPQPEPQPEAQPEAQSVAHPFVDPDAPADAGRQFQRQAVDVELEGDTHLDRPPLCSGQRQGDDAQPC